jgi:hypothetical protein
MADETPGRLIEGYINSLAFHEVEEPWTLLPDRKPSRTPTSPVCRTAAPKRFKS